MIKTEKGIYLVIDPSMPEGTLFDKLERVLSASISYLQIWDNYTESKPAISLIEQICAICHSNNIPVILNNRWEYIHKTPADGVHFDVIPANFNEIKKALPEKTILGLTCNNNLEDVKWADTNQLDYISFCSVFPSKTSNSCDLVSFDTIKKAAEITKMPIFLAGGIRPENLDKLSGLPFSGVAVVSGIMSAEDPRQALNQYNNKLNSTSCA
ncbi:MAG: thiamine phosphate synthase [Cyclobacteriaceae bacterium]|nr:thiamine phosphate synthase [Cyclobacteriaceae bacterium]